MADFKLGDPVKICRPNKKMHGWLARFTSQESDTPFGWVAVEEAEKDRLTTLPPADADKLRRQDKYPRKLFPLSQIQRYEQPS